MGANHIERNVTRKMRIRIRGEEAALQNPLFAINWFDTRAAPIYHLYNFLAGPRAFKVGAKALFKGKHVDTIYGNPELKRNFLLIVNYPSANNFLDLASDKIFQILSVLRIGAVKDFSFVLHKRHQGEQLLTDRLPKGDKQGSYAVVQLSESSGAASGADLAAEVGALAKQHNVEMFFAGSAAGRLSTVGQDDKETALLAITERTFVFSATSDAILKDFIVSQEFQSLIGIGESSTLESAPVFAATLKRLM